jgi:hypothetical protein
MNQKRARILKESLKNWNTRKPMTLTGMMLNMRWYGAQGENARIYADVLGGEDH